MTFDWIKSLTTPAAYEAAIHHVVDSSAWRSKPEARQQQGVTLSSMRFAAPTLAKALCKDVKKGQYKFSPGIALKIVVNEKERTVYQFTPLDRVMHVVVTNILGQLAAKELVPNVYSYRDGFSYIGAVQSLSAFVRSHRRSTKDPLQRGLYLVRTDISAYFDSIPTAEDSPFWPWLKQLLGPELVDKNPHLWDIFKQTIHPRIIDIAGEEGYMPLGVPTGSPVSNAIANLYLADLDAKLAATKNGFYARYGDDIIFASAKEEITRSAIDIITAGLSNLELSLNAKKQLALFFNGAGRQSPVCGYEGNNRVEFLGFSIDFHGTVMLRPKRVNTMLGELEERLKHLVRLHRNSNLSTDDLGKMVTSHLNRALDPNCSHCHHYAPILRKVVTDRSQLQQLDYKLIRMIIKVVTGSARLGQLQDYPPRYVREHWGYRSLVVLRNNEAKKKRK